MLFHPRRARTLLGFKWQGLIPKRQEEIATKVGDLIEKDLLGEGWLKRELTEVDLTPYLETLARRIVRERFMERLQQIPLIGSFINDKLVDQIEETVIEEIVDEAQPLIDQIATDLEKKFTIKTKVYEAIMRLDLTQLESAVYSLARKELKGIERLGGFLGFIIGVIQSSILFFLINSN